MSINYLKIIKKEIYMEKIYGYKEKDIIGLAEFLQSKGNQSLSKVFENYGVKYGKAKGTVRNLYYALAKMSVKDSEFCDKYLNGKPLNVGKIVEFKDCEERQLIKKILIATANGKSVRGAIMELSNGEGKVALRFQNKYRNAIKNKPALINEIIKELQREGTDVCAPCKEDEKEFLSEMQFKKLKNEINNLVFKIAEKEKRENARLKERIILLEKENLRLCNALYGSSQPAELINFFSRGGERNVLN